MIEVSRVRVFEVAFEAVGVDCNISLTEWPSAEGYTVNLTSGESETVFEVHNDVLDALLNLHVYASTYKEPTNEMAN